MKFKLLICIFSFLSFSCQRSPEYKQDQTYFQNEPPSYYNKGGNEQTTITKRIEMMGQPKKRVVVLRFWNDTPVKVSDIGSFAAEELRRNLLATQRMLLPEEVHPDLTTQDVVQGSQVKTSQLIREGRRMGVSVLVIGRLPKIVFRQKGDDVGLFRQKQSLAAVDIEIKIFDVASGREILTTAKSGESSSNAIAVTEANDLESGEFRSELTRLAVRNAVSSLVPDVIRSVEKMTWQGHIAKTTGTKVYVNAGKASGLVAGDILKVLAQGDDIFDPTSGAFLGRTEGQLKGTVEVVDFIGTDGAITQVHTGGNFQSGDLVQLY